MIQLVCFDSGDGGRPGLLRDGKVFAFDRYATIAAVLADWDKAEARLADGAALPADATPVQRAALLAPITSPSNIYFAGANYRDHVEEMKRELGMPLDADPRASGVRPWHSLKATGSSVVGPGAVVRRPGGTEMLDWELELAVVIGRRAKDVDLSDALGCVAGYTVANDLSARDHVGRRGVADTSPFKWDWIAQKSFDGSCPLGPAMTPAAAIGDVQNLDMKLWVNGELKQDSNTGQMIFSAAEQIAYLSSRVTLQPGDVILTGTPAGVGMAHRTFLRPGDVVRQWIQNVGEFEFSIA